MTNRIAPAFASLRASGRKALVAYLCMGDPTIEESIELAVEAAEAGADVLELGVPFSDPTADGPAIARASGRAIRNGATILGVLAAARAIRERTSVPLVLFTYYNPVLVTGEARVIDLAREAGIDGMLVVDLPPEEGRELRGAAARAGIAVVPLFAPTSDDARVDAVLRELGSVEGAPAGFLYYVSMTGVTGAAVPDLVAARKHAAALRVRSSLPVVVGFGIDGPAAAVEAAGRGGEGADGIVVGSALVRRIEAGETREARGGSVRAFVGELRAALDGE